MYVYIFYIPVQELGIGKIEKIEDFSSVNSFCVCNLLTVKFYRLVGSLKFYRFIGTQERLTHELKYIGNGYLGIIYKYTLKNYAKA